MQKPIVSFEVKYFNTVVGTIVRFTRCAATIDTGGGTSRRVGFGLLHHVLDI